MMYSHNAMTVTNKYSKSHPCSYATSIQILFTYDIYVYTVFNGVKARLKYTEGLKYMLGSAAE